MSTITFTSPNTQGRSGREGANESFATIIAAAGNASASSVTIILQSYTVSNEWQAVRRAFFVYNTALSPGPLPTGFIITSATLTITPSTLTTDYFTQSLCLTSAILANEATVANGDYLGTSASRTEYAARKTYASLVDSTPFSFTFNATGLAYLTTKFTAGANVVLGVRWSSDIDQSSPTWQSGVTQSVNQIASAAQLAVSYRIGPGNAIASITGTLGNSADTVTCNMFVLELFT
jgi:hypothetical protein